MPHGKHRSSRGKFRNTSESECLSTSERGIMPKLSERAEALFTAIVVAIIAFVAIFGLALAVLSEGGRL